MSKIAALFLVGLLVQVPARADGLTEAYAAYVDGDFAATLKLIKPLAESGDIRAEFIMGYMYENGHIADKNIAEAAQWYRQAADQGDALSQIRLGRLYEVGTGVPQNYVEASKMYLKAAEQGSAIGHFRLANLYEHGNGVPNDIVLAHLHFKIAAAGYTNLPAKERRDEVAKLMTTEQKSESRRMGLEWITAHPPMQLSDPYNNSEE